MKATSTRTKVLLLSTFSALLMNSAYSQTKPLKELQGADTLISVNTTWDADTIYYLKGHVFVASGAELTIQPGTVIVGDTIFKGTLFITKGSKIHAVGTPECPIVFTSAKAPGSRSRGDWGGVVLLGLSTTNNPGGVQNIEGIAPSALTEFGGGASPNLHDNSGEMEYVRIEFPGVALAPNNEINGLTLGAVGDSTVIDHVQVSYSNDDSYEWFGGTVNCKHLIAFRGLDDDFDTDNGYSGKVQFGIGLRDPLQADVSGSNGFESDNNATGTSDVPQTTAVFSNITIDAGSDSATNPNFRRNAHIRRNSHLYIYNSVLMGYPLGVYIDGSSTQLNVLADTMVKHNVCANVDTSNWVLTNTVGTDSTNVLTLLRYNADNRFYTGNSEVLLKDPYNLTAPNVQPNTGSPALTGANFFSAGLNDTFFVQTTYVGAITDADDWTATWSNWTPNSTDYSLVNASCSALPVTLLSFTAQRNNSDVILNWKIADEINMKGYEIQKADNSNNFRTITFVPAYNNSKNEVYEITDKNAFINASIVNYRIRQIDLNGTIHYSQIISVRNTGTVAKIIVPNPFRSTLQVQFNVASSQTVGIRIHDLQGRLVAVEKSMTVSPGATAISLNSTSTLAPGTYLMQVTLDGERYVYKIIKQ